MQAAIADQASVGNGRNHDRDLLADILQQDFQYYRHHPQLPQPYQNQQLRPAIVDFATNPFQPTTLNVVSPPEATIPDFSSPTPTAPVIRHLANSAPPSAPTALFSTRPVAAPPGQRGRQLSRQATFLRSLQAGDQSRAHPAEHKKNNNTNHNNNNNNNHNNHSMTKCKIWVRRGSASATLVTINDDDLVDDVRDLILRKYANSLGRQFDAPDLTLRITPREQIRQSRTLGPEEPMCRVLDAYFPGGQTVDEALVIEIPLRRSTPRPSPRAGPPHAPQLTSVLFEEVQPADASTDYFGPGAIAQLPFPAGAAGSGMSSPHSIAVLTNGQIPQVPSPGGSRTRAYRDRQDRPRLGRQHTSSPTLLGMVSAPQAAAFAAVAAAAAASNTANPLPAAQARSERPRTHSNASSDHSTPGGPPNAPAPPPMPTPPAPDPPAPVIQRVATPPPRVSSPRPVSSRPKKKKTIDHPTTSSSSIVTAVPPISVLIVEDNIINLRLLEQFVKRLKVRWQTAMNGQEAVTKWRAGGFHLVLMDIQLPIMNGLDATREIRRLERVNSIGVMTSSSKGRDSESGSDDGDEPPEEDRLPNRDLFKSPVIIVALTASSLQSDRQHALAAGCNDFLTKPLIFAWFQRKVMEWGCMQALIDFDGWRKWKDFSHQAGETDATKKTAAKAKTKKNRLSLTTSST